MSDVIRVFVEKRKGFDVEAGQILADLRDNLGLTGIEALRLVNRYDVEGLSAEEFEQARNRTPMWCMTKRCRWKRAGRCLRWNICPVSTTSGRIPRLSACSC